MPIDSPTKRAAQRAKEAEKARVPDESEIVASSEEADVRIRELQPRPERSDWRPHSRMRARGERAFDLPTTAYVRFAPEPAVSVRSPCGTFRTRARSDDVGSSGDSVAKVEN